METTKQVTLITSDIWMSVNGGPWSWQGFSKDIQGKIEVIDLY